MSIKDVGVQARVGRRSLLDRHCSRLYTPATTRSMAFIVKLAAVALLIAQGAIAAPWYDSFLLQHFRYSALTSLCI